jgi:hypothetical protein
VAKSVSLNEHVTNSSCKTHLRLFILLDLVLVLGILLCISLLLLSRPIFRLGLCRLTLFDKGLDKGTLLAVGEMFLAVGKKCVRQRIGLINPQYVVIHASPRFQP